MSSPEAAPAPLPRVQWVTVKDAAHSAGVDARTVFRWCRSGLIRARKLAAGFGPWRVLIDEHGLPVDAPAGRAEHAGLAARRARRRARARRDVRASR